ncbi:uncharacterized protein PF11_0207-like [Photinus pyralis]|uniref:uncharacterized protein PF11_0207-like n=1 Tax=Photinus pyralis TaxID=7054 RepID=UPI001266E794|nr:uncharacterized protein PF11_0207-like [Photinus pyralis]XP_031334089.1 uncharacterized protein PF11_0207-like [Photinus pyralis]
MEEILHQIKQQLGRIETKLDDCQKQIQEIRNENQQLKKENEELKTTIAHQNDKIGYLEREIKKNNLIIHGVKEMENENELQLKEATRIILREMGINEAVEAEISEIYRIGKPENNKTRPVFIKIKNHGLKVQIIKHAKNLRGTEIYISEDYPKHIIETRRTLIPYMKKTRETGHHSYIKYDKLMVNGEEYKLEELEVQEPEETNTDMSKKGRTISQRSPTNSNAVSKKAISLGNLTKN